MIKWVLKLLRKCLDLQAFLLQSVAQFNDLFLVTRYCASFLLLELEVALQLTNFEPEKLYVLETLAILCFSTCNRRLQNLDLLVEQANLIVATNHLSAKNITLCSRSCEKLTRLLVLTNRVINYEFHVIDFALLLGAL